MKTKNVCMYMMLKIFLKFPESEPRDSYNLDSCKNKVCTWNSSLNNYSLFNILNKNYCGFKILISSMQYI